MIQTVLSTTPGSLVTEDDVVLPGASLVEETLSANAGVLPSPSFHVLAEQAAGIQQHPMDSFYYRIWVVPELLSLNNPQLNTPISFSIFNAFPFSNDLVSIGGSSTTGLVLNFEAPQTYGPIEYRDVTFLITEDAPPSIDATFLFTFDVGDGELDITGTVSDFVQMLPDPPVVEKWEWLTDVLVAWDGSEQRIAHRGAPRRTISYTLPLDNEADRRRQYLRYFSSLGIRVSVPFYQYSGIVAFPSAAGGSTIYLDTSRTDLRAGEFAMLYDTSTDAGFLLQIDTVNADNIVLDNALSLDVTPGMLVAPMFNCRIVDKRGPSMRAIVGSLRFEAQVVKARMQLERPGSAASLTMLGGLPVLDRRPLANGELNEDFDAGIEVMDGLTGEIEMRTAWAHPFVSSARQYLVNRWLEPTEMDWWRAMLNHANGQQNPFWVPTWRDDLVLFAAPDDGSVNLQVVGSEFGDDLAPNETYMALQLETAAGVIRRTVVSVSVEESVTTAVLNAALSGGETTITRVSFLNLTRLGSDTVTLTHEHGHTYIDLALRTINA